MWGVVCSVGCWVSGLGFTRTASPSTQSETYPDNTGKGMTNLELAKRVKFQGGAGRLMERQPPELSRDVTTFN